jgi:glycolate dehydrogenase FAD-binding subunit
MVVTTASPAVLRPSDLVELHAAVADTAASRLLIQGSGTAADWGGIPSTPDAVLDTTSMTGVLAYNPADMTVAVRAGTPMSVVQQELAEHGQQVAFDAARVALGATVGGLVATGDSGPYRQRFGMLRDLVIGVTVVLADATVARSGGHVIKNVAGYDLAKLFHGSLGTLGVLAEVILRLHPVPQASATVSIQVSAAQAHEVAAQVVEPSALEWVDGRLLARLEGPESSVEARAASSGGVVLRGEDETTAWQDVASIAIGEAGDTVLRAGTMPSDGGWFAGRVEELASGHGVTARLTMSAGTGVHTVSLRGGESHQAVVDRLRDDVVSRGGVVSLRRRDGLAATDDAWGPPPPAVAVMRAVKRAFDPDDRFGAGRFAPWF